MQKPLIILIMPLAFHLLINGHFIFKEIFLTNCRSYLLFSNISLPFHEFHLREDWPRTTLLNHEQLFQVNQNLLARTLRDIFSPSSVFFQLTRFSLHRTTSKYSMIISIAWAYSVLTDWIIFNGDQNWLALLKFHIALSKILLTACADQLL